MNESGINVSGWGFDLAEILRNLGPSHWMNLVEHQWFPISEEEVIEIREWTGSEIRGSARQALTQYSLQCSAIESPPFVPNPPEDSLKFIKQIMMENASYALAERLRSQAAKLIPRRDTGDSRGAERVEEDFPYHFRTANPRETPVEPYVREDTEKGIKWMPNPEYEKAEYRDVFYLSPGSLICLNPPRIGVNKDEEGPGCRFGTWVTRRQEEGVEQADGTYKTIWTHPEMWYVRVVMENAIAINKEHPSAVIRELR